MTSKAENVIQKFTPEHISEQIPQNMEALKEETQRATEDVSKQKDDIDDPKSKVEYTFQFKWKSPSGKIFEGQFTNKILTLAEQQAAGLMRSKLNGGMPFDSIDPLTSEINLILSHLSFSLIERPSWAENLRDLHEIELLQSIYMEVASHGAVFRGY